ncbi:MAG: helix-turn-helix domain-containing protein [Planctomycetota bacterium]
MDGAKPSPFPQHSWFHLCIAGNAPQKPLVVTMTCVAHAVSLTARGRHAIRSICRARELSWEEPTSTVHFLPADGEDRTFVTTMSPDFQSQVFLIPRRHLEACLNSEGLAEPAELRRLLAHDDPILQACLTRLAATVARADADVAADEAARRFVLRLAECAGGRRPDWHADASFFDRRTLSNLVHYIDEHLRIAPSLAEMALMVGLSPSHFAKKFRLSTGLSLHRFINRRRLRRAFELLKSPTASLADISLDLGFSSQSHFTRLFSLITGMTPAKYAKQFRPTLG